MKWLRREWWVIVAVLSVIAFLIFFQAVAGTHARLTFRRFEAFGSTHVAVFAIENRSVHPLYFEHARERFVPPPGSLICSHAAATSVRGHLHPEHETEIHFVVDPVGTAADNRSAEVKVWRANVDDNAPLRRLQRWLPRWLTVDDSRVLRSSVVKP